MGVISLAKISKHFRLSSETLGEMETLITYLSAEKNVKLNLTSLIETLVSERYSELLNRSEPKIDRRLN